MSLTNKLRRFDLIITKLERAKYPSLKTLINYLNTYDCRIVARTLQRDFEELKTEFKVFIEYDSFHRGYFIEKDTITDSVIQFIKNMSLQANLLDFAKSNQQSDAIILKEKHDLKGVEFIPKILTAIQHHFQIEFSYHAFDSELPKKYTMQPYALKEFLGRWYMVGVLPGKSSVTKFGVDRITILTIAETKFKLNKKIDLNAYFSRMIGIIDNGAEREIVVLSFTPFQANYIKTLPLHWSQKEILTNEHEVRFEYFILTNYELQQKILSYGAEVNVIQPVSLQKKHQQILKDAQARYK
jgi:predicted DNA-binding transcriptional regulator YafY